MRVLALDFDGVLVDSAAEAFEVALRTFAALRPASGLDALPRGEVYARFLELMPLGNRAEDYGVALAAIEQGLHVASQADYDALLARQDPAWLERFHRDFYRERQAWARRDREAWLACMRPYDAVLDLARRRADDVTLAIATAKDRATVRALLRSWRADALFPEERVLDKESGRSKRAHLETLARRAGVALRDVTFVDDKVNHLEGVASLGVRCALATWGYNGPREHARARALGFLVIDLTDAEAVLFR